MDPAEWLDASSDFPELIRDRFEVTSPADPYYNCIAWAVGDTDTPWWPGSLGCYWPRRVPPNDSVDAFKQLFATLGFTEITDNPDLEDEFEKVAIFALGNATKHAARQLPDGTWTSKLGTCVDISHDLRAVEGPCYGRLVAILKRPAEAARRRKSSSPVD